MQIYNNEIEFSLNRAKEAADNYKLTFIGSDAYERSVDRLIEIAHKNLGKNIALFELDLDKEESPIWGACIAYEDRYEICRVKGLNYCWDRFITCKEVFHTILDKDEYRNVSLCAHVNEAAVVFPDPTYAEKPSVQVMAEQLAEIAAMEFLFPYEQREKELAKGGAINSHDIAERYRVPRVLVERYLSPRYMEPLSKFNK